MTTRETLVFADEAAWLRARTQDITSTEAAALFNAGAYTKTEYELFLLKTGQIQPGDFQANARMKWGNRLEAPIALGIAEDLGLIVEPMKCYMRIAELRMGSSFDFKVVGLTDGFDGNEAARNMFRRHGPGILEVKNIDGLQFRRSWIEEGDEIEAPPHIEFQVQWQLEVADVGWSLIAPLVGGNTPKPIIRARDTELGAIMRKKAADFWARVATGQAPAPDFMKDADVIAQQYVENDGSHIDLSDNFHVVALCQRYKAAAAEERAAGERKKAAKAELLTIIEHAKSATTNGFKISAGTNKESYRVYHREAGERWTISKSIIPAGDVEATVPAYRNVRISEVA